MAGVPPIKGEAFTFTCALTSQADTDTFQANPTLAAGDVQVSIDGGAFANLTTLPTVSPAAGRQVEISLSAAEMNGDVIGVLFHDAAGDEWQDLYVEIFTDTQQTGDLCASGAGTTAVTYTLTSSVAPNPPIADADIWVTTDVAGTNIIASGQTDAAGQVTFYLDSGSTVYIWRQKSGWDFTNPDTEVVP
jgi:hypothetical protein